MLVKDYSLVVKGDKENIRLMVEHKDLNPEIGERLIKANGLRNILVHRYNGIDDSIISDSIQEITDVTEIWLNKIEEFLNELRNLE